MSPTLLAYAAGLYLWSFVEVLFHEAAHVLAAKIVGFSPFALIVGKGPLLFQRRIHGVDVRLHLFPFLGGLAKAKVVLDGLRWRGALFSIAGVLSDAVLFALLLRLAGFKAGAPDVGQSSAASAFFALLALYQLVTILASLVPMHVKVLGFCLPNDGRQFLDYLRGVTSRALQHYEEGVARYDPQFRIADSWLMRGDLQLINLLSAAEQDMAAGRHREAADKYVRLIEQAGAHPAEKAQLLDRIACIPVFHGDRSLLPAAEAWAKQAVALLPLCKTVRGTLGSILVEKGDCAEGVALLMPLTSEDNTPIDRVLACSYIAKAFNCLGNRIEAGKWLAAARRHGGFSEVVSRIESELALA